MVSYDIAENKTRTALATLLINSGLWRIQKSVFLGKPHKGIVHKVRLELNKFQEKRMSESDKIYVQVIPRNHVINRNFIGDYDNELVEILTGDKKVWVI